MPPFGASSTFIASVFGSLWRLFFFLALNASLPAETINIAKVRLERPLSNETALARAWIFLLGAFLALLTSCKQKVFAKAVPHFDACRWLD